MKLGKPIRFILSFLFVSLIFFSQSAWALTLSATIEGVRQGVIEGDNTERGQEKTILLRGFGHNMFQPVDPNTLMISGRIMTQPFKVLKNFDKSSPKLLQAMVTGETLKSVLIKLFDNDPQTGVSRHFYTIELLNGMISSIASTGIASTGNDSSIGAEEVVGFTFQIIRLTDVLNGTTAEYTPSVPLN